MNRMLFIVFALGILAADVFAGTNDPAALPMPPYRFRKLEDKFCDLGPLFEWNRQCATVRRYNAQITVGRAARGMRMMGEPPNPMPAWVYRTFEIVAEKRNNLLIFEHKRSHPIRMSQGRPGAYGDSLIVDRIPLDSSFSALTNHPDFSRLKVGDSVLLFYSIRTSHVEYNGKQIPLYDHGVPYLPKAGIAAKESRH